MSVVEGVRGGSSGGDLALLAVADRASDRMRKVLTTYALGRALVGLGTTAWNRLEDRRTYTVTITGQDRLYPLVQEWFLQSLPPERQRSLLVKTESADSDGSPGELLPAGARPPQRVLKALYDSSRTQQVTIREHRIEVELQRLGLSEDISKRVEELPSWLASGFRLVFTASSVEGRDAVLGLFSELLATQDRRKPRLHTSDRWGSWNSRADVSLRSPSSVILRHGLMDSLISDLEHFFASERAYGDLGYPFHRGYLFHGPPGTGKTSTAKALAEHFGLDVFYCPLAALADDSRLLALMTALEPRSMLLLEDIDCVSGARERLVRSDGEPGVSMSGLLNCLDGVVTPHGLVTVMTTNDVTVLDEAILRRGRVDRQEEFGLLQPDQLLRMVEIFLGRDYAESIRMAGWPLALVDDLPPAAVAETLVSHLGDPEGAFVALKELIG